MGMEHVDATCGWLMHSAELRRQIDSLDVPDPEGNRAYWQRKFKDGSREDYAILDDENRHVGNCGLTGIDLRRGKAELWIYLGEARGKGAGQAALQLLLERAFSGLGLSRVHLRVVASNERALAFYERAGFSIEGRARGDTIHDGVRLDSILLSLLAEEYKSPDRSKDGSDK